MRYLLSTEACRYFIASKSTSLIQRIEMVGFEQVGISSISSYQLYLSALDSDNPKKNTAALNQFLNCFQSVEFIKQDAYTSADILHFFQQENYPIGQLDLAIIAQVINRNMILITDEWREFPSQLDIKSAIWN